MRDDPTGFSTPGGHGVLPLQLDEVRIERVPDLPLCLVIGSRQTENLASILEGIVGFPVPRLSNRCTWSVNGAGFCLRFSPRQWLTGSAEGIPLAEQLRAGLADVTSSVLDATGSLLGVRIAGTKAAQLLSKGCHLDVRSSVFALGSGVRTHFVFDAAFIVRRLDPVDDFTLYYDGSFDAPMAEWLVESSRSLA